jgi:hypothetical protein
MKTFTGPCYPTWLSVEIPDVYRIGSGSGNFRLAQFGSGENALGHWITDPMGGSNSTVAGILRSGHILLYFHVNGGDGWGYRWGY